MGADDRRNTIGFPAERTPVSVELFTSEPGGWRLSADKCRRVRVLADGEVQPIGGRESSHSSASIALDEGAQGRLQLGGLTVVFRCVARPNGVARAALPRDVEQNPAGVLDRSLLAVLVLAVAATAGLTGWFEFGEWPQPKEDPTLQPNQQFATIEPREAAPMMPPEPKPELEPEEQSGPAARPEPTAEPEAEPAKPEPTEAEVATTEPEADRAPEPTGSSDSNRREVAEGGKPEGTILDAELDEIRAMANGGEVSQEERQAFNGASRRGEEAGSSGSRRPTTAANDSDGESGRAVGGGPIEQSDTARRAQQHRESTDREEVAVSARQPIEPRDIVKNDRH